ncbi:hypothetical protein [Loigolactobacillus coryniformis]|uniref:hypothetical protein n=1 Tax=Loigolactobacillus coryniformis TaxID=1610 RepID=UPI0002FB91A1|nr:hypothetical protein [Loigolactobacillus coryniformis]
MTDTKADKIRKIKKALNLDQDEIELATNDLEPEKLDELVETAKKFVTRQMVEAYYEWS